MRNRNMRFRLALLPIALCAVALHAQPKLIAHTAAGCTANCNNSEVPTATTGAIDTTGANFILICAGEFAGQFVAPTDSQKNTWTDVSDQANSDVHLHVYVEFHPQTSTRHTFTLSAPGAALAIQAWSGIAAGLDQSTTSDGSTSALEITPESNNELVTSCLAGFMSNPSTSIHPPLTLADSIDYDKDHTGSEAIGSAYEVQESSHSEKPTWNYGDMEVALSAQSFFSIQSPGPLLITATSLPEGLVDAPYGINGFQMQSRGGIGPYTWQITKGSLPAGLSMSSSGLISGQPKAAASAVSLTFKVKDAQARTQSVTLPMTVASGLLTLKTKSCVLSGRQNTAYAGCKLVASGGAPPYTYSWSTSDSFSSIPPGLTLNPTTGAIAGINYGSGTYTTQYIVTDVFGSTAEALVKLELMENIGLGNVSLFPTDSIVHLKIANLPVDASPAADLSSYQAASIRPFFGSASAGNQPNGIPILSVAGNIAPVPDLTTKYQCYFGNSSVSYGHNACLGPLGEKPGLIPLYAPIEQTSNGENTDRHVLVVTHQNGNTPPALWEMWRGAPSGEDKSWAESSNAYWPNLTASGPGAYQMLPQDNGSTDAAGLPVAPYLVTSEEVNGTGTAAKPNGKVTHAVRFTVNHMLNAYVWPATAHAGVGTCTGGYENNDQMLLQQNPSDSCSQGGPAGEIYRLKASVATPACAAYSPQSAIIIQGFRDYGIILADNGLTGGLIGTPSAGWNDADLKCLQELHLWDFEPVNVSGAMPVVTGYSIHNNVVTFDAVNNVLTAGRNIFLVGFPGSTFLNATSDYSRMFTVLASPAPTRTSFSVTLKHADAEHKIETGYVVSMQAQQ